MQLLDLPLELRLQIWNNILTPTTVLPCNCLPQTGQCKSTPLGMCCNNTSTYMHCDNRILRLNRQIFDEVQPLVQKVEKERMFVLCNNLCLENFFKSMNERDWKWVKHLRVDLFVGWGGDAGQDDWFLCQSHRWAKRYLAGVLYKYDQGRKTELQPAEDVREDANGRRTLTVDIYLE